MDTDTSSNDIFILCIYFWPWRADWINVVDTGLCVCLVLMSVCATVFLVKRPRDNQAGAIEESDSSRRMLLGSSVVESNNTNNLQMNNNNINSNFFYTTASAVVNYFFLTMSDSDNNP